MSGDSERGREIYEMLVEITELKAKGSRASPEEERQYIDLTTHLASVSLDDMM